MRRKRLSVENGFVAALAVVGLILCIVVRDVGLKVGFGSISLLLGFYLVLNFVNTEKAVCPQCGKRLRKRRIRKDRVSRGATGNGSPGRLSRLRRPVRNAKKKKPFGKNKKTFTGWVNVFRFVRVQLCFIPSFSITVLQALSR